MTHKTFTYKPLCAFVLCLYYGYYKYKLSLAQLTKNYSEYEEKDLPVGQGGNH